MPAAETRDDRQRARRAARRDANRAEILDAAEAAFAREGLHNASMRSIAAAAGFSTAAIYLFFENRQHLLADTITRRGDELNDLIESVVRATPEPLAALHAVADATVAFFTDHTPFRRILHELRGGRAIVGPALEDYAAGVEERMDRAQRLLGGVVEAGQAQGSIRSGNAHAIAQLYMVLVNEFVYLRADTDLEYPDADFHALVDGALRGPRD
jgi:AcrR family transcriptional regulator